MNIWHKVVGFNKSYSIAANRRNGVDLPIELKPIYVYQPESKYPGAKRTCLYEDELGIWIDCAKMIDGIYWCYEQDFLPKIKSEEMA